MKNLTPFVTSQGYVYSGEEGLRGQGYSLNLQQDSHDDGCRVEVSMRIDNGTGNTLPVDSIGMDLVYNAAGRAEDWLIYLDAGECAWCGVRRLTDLTDDPHLGKVVAQRTEAIDGGSNTEADGLGRSHRSSLVSVLWNPVENAGVLVGFLSQKSGHGTITAAFDADNSSGVRIVLHAGQRIAFEYADLPDFELPPGESISSDVLMYRKIDDPLDALVTYGGEVREKSGRGFTDPTIVGYMSWYGFRTAVDREKILSAASIASELFRGYPQAMDSVVIIDHGWQVDANWGHWFAEEKRFPGGLERLGVDLRGLGFRLGIWYTPSCVTEGSPALEERMDTLTRDGEGELREGQANVWGQLPGHGRSRKIYFPDSGIEEVHSRWREELARMIDWGASYFKIDFFKIHTSRAREFRYVELLRKTWETMRDTVGPKVHLAPCSAPTNEQLGFADSVRIAADIGNTGTWPGAKDTYRYGFTTLAALWYKHRNFWINDPDSIQIGKGCSWNEARVRATAAAMSGGHIMLSEDLASIEPGRLDLVRRLLPAYGIAAVPVNLFASPFPEGIPDIWRWEIDTQHGPLRIFGLFNFDESTKTFDIPAKWFNDGTKEHIAIEWWNMRWLGRFKDALSVEVAPEDVAVLHVAPISSVPRAFTCSHPISGGWILEDQSFDEESGKLSVTVVSKANIPLVIAGFCPEGYKLAQSGAFHASVSSTGGWSAELRTTSTRSELVLEFVPAR